MTSGGAAANAPDSVSVPACVTNGVRGSHLPESRLSVKEHSVPAQAAETHRSFVPSLIGSVSISLRDFTMACVRVLYFLK